MCNRLPPHIPGHCPPPEGEMTLATIREAVERFRSNNQNWSLDPASTIALGEALELGDPGAERLLALIDPFCPRHGRASRPIEVPGLRCDCPGRG